MFTADTGQFDLTALLIFLAFCAWQIPHTYAIAVVVMTIVKATFRCCRWLKAIVSLKIKCCFIPPYTFWRFLSSDRQYSCGHVLLLNGNGHYWFDHNAHDADETSKQHVLGVESYFYSIMAVSLMMLFSINFVWSWLFEFNWLY